MHSSIRWAQSVGPAVVHPVRTASTPKGFALKSMQLNHPTLPIAFLSLKLQPPPSWGITEIKIINAPQFELALFEGKTGFKPSNPQHTARAGSIDGLQRRMPTAQKYIEFLPENLRAVEVKVVQSLSCRKAWEVSTFDVAMPVDEDTAKQFVLLLATSGPATWWRAAKKLKLTKVVSLPSIRSLTADLSLVLGLESSNKAQASFAHASRQGGIFVHGSVLLLQQYW